MVVDTKKLLDEIVAMRNDVKKGYLLDDQYKLLYKFTYENTPTLFRMVLKNDSNYMTVLNTLIKNVKKIETNEISQEDADVIIGQELADKYIYPNIDMSKETV